MAVRFSRQGTNTNIQDHNELLNRGIRTHEEIDQYLAEIDAARGSYASLKERLDFIEGAVYPVIQHIIVDETYLSQNDGLTITINPPYIVGKNYLDVFYNGQFLRAGGGYEEVDNFTIKLNLGVGDAGQPITLAVGDEIVIRNWASSYPATGGMGVYENLKLLSLEDEIEKARQYQSGDISYTSLDERLDYLQAKAEASNERVIVFVIPGRISAGEQKVEIRFPFNGVITGVTASCRVPGSAPSTIQVEKISEADYDNNLNSWVSILSQALTLPSGKKISSSDYVIGINQVMQGDYFRLNITEVGNGIEDLTVELTINC